MAHAEQTVPDWAIGCMEREYIVLDGGERDPSPAIWIQTESQYIDIRVPHDRLHYRGKRSLQDFDADELMGLARQSGDTGVCTIEDRVATWNSWGDRFGFFCDEVDVFPDDGRLELRRGTIFETETEKSRIPYEEAWVQQPYGRITSRVWVVSSLPLIRLLGRYITIHRRTPSNIVQLNYPCYVNWCGFDVDRFPSQGSRYSDSKRCCIVKKWSSALGWGLTHDATRGSNNRRYVR